MNYKLYVFFVFIYSRIITLTIWQILSLWTHWRKMIWLMLLNPMGSMINSFGVEEKSILPISHILRLNTWMMLLKKLSLSIKLPSKLLHISLNPKISNGECHLNQETFLIVKTHLDRGIMAQCSKLLTILTVLNLFVLPSRFMIRMETRLMKMENFMDSKTSNKLLMLLYPESCLFVPRANTEITKSPSHHSKLMTQMTWFLKKLEDKKFMLYREKETFQNFISGN